LGRSLDSRSLGKRHPKVLARSPLIQERLPQGIDKFTCDIDLRDSERDRATQIFGGRAGTPVQNVRGQNAGMQLRQAIKVKLGKCSVHAMGITDGHSERVDLGLLDKGYCNLRLAERSFPPASTVV